MSVVKQLLLVILVALAGIGAWFVWQQASIYLRSGETAAVATAGGPRGPGAPGAGAPAAGGPARGGQGAPAGGGQRGPGGFGGGGGPALVVVAPVTIDNTGTDVRAIGTLAAARAVTLYPQVTGVVSAVSFKPGSEVESGELLLKLDDADQQIAVERARIALDTANEAVSRSERLQKSGNVTAVTLADARSARQQAGIDLKSAELELAKRSIYAPFGGTIGLSDITVGDLVSSSKAIATLDDMATVTGAFDVPERVVGQVKVGDIVKTSTDALPGQDFEGRVSAVDSRIDPASRTLRLEATVPNEAEVLKPGMAVAITLTIPSEPRPLVPALAVQWDREGSFVWKLDGDKVHRVAVQIVSRHSGTVIVAGDLAKGDQVVTEGVLRLREGGTVARTQDPGALAPPAAPAPVAPPVASQPPAANTPALGGATAAGKNG